MACFKANSDNWSEDRLWQKEMTTSTIEKWPIFNLLPPTLASRVLMAAVFGRHGKSAIFFTSDGEAFGLGDNNFGCLGVGHENECLEPTKIEGLTNVKIKTMAFGWYNVVAVTESGSVLAWGDNQFHQLGINRTTIISLVPEQVSALNHYRVVDVACGYQHTLALTENGEVFAWGTSDHGQLGLGLTYYAKTPIKVDEVIGSRRAVTIGCCEQSSFAVMDNGEIYAWGYRKELGLECDSNKWIPTRIENLNGVRIRRLACGGRHVLALTEDGFIYVWGNNSHGQLGTGDKKDRIVPAKIKVPKVRFVAVAASVFNDFSAALSGDGRCWVWGGKLFKLPEEIHSASLHDAFAEFVVPRVTWKSFLVRQSPTNRVIDRLMSAFDDPTSDFKFLVDGKQIHVHRSVLKIQSQYFKMMFSGEWSESVQDEVKVEQWSYPVFYAFLKYLYTGEFVDLLVDQIIQLIDLANFYLETDIQMKCQELIKTKFNGCRECFNKRLLIIEKPPDKRIIDNLKSAFDDPTTSDFMFLVDGKQIHVHKSVLKIQCQYFQTMFSGDWNESNKVVVEVEQWSYPVFRAFLNYLYTGEVKLPIDEIIQLIDLANCYLESELEIKCHRLFRKNLSVENAALAYAAACESNEKSVEEYCFQFIKDHLDYVEKNEGFQCLDKEIKNKFLNCQQPTIKKLKIG